MTQPPDSSPRPGRTAPTPGPDCPHARPASPFTAPPPNPQMFELLLTLSGSPRYQRLLAPALPEMAALCVSYSQMSSAQEEAWASDPNALIADEESEFVGCR